MSICADQHAHRSPSQPHLGVHQFRWWTPSRQDLSLYLPPIVTHRRSRPDGYTRGAPVDPQPGSGCPLSGWRGAKTLGAEILKEFPKSAPQESELAVARANAGGSRSWPRLEGADGSEAGALKHWDWLGATLNPRTTFSCWLARIVLSDNQQAAFGKRASRTRGKACECSSQGQPAT
jgi:hypothetical protein